MRALSLTLLAMALASAPALAQTNTTDTTGTGDPATTVTNATSPNGTAVAVTLEAPAFQVCWDVDGNGTVAQTALYWDDVSHATNATGGNATDGNATDANATTDSDRLALYDGGVAYPNGSTTADPAGYALPGRFCADVPAATGTVYMVAAVIPAGNATVLVSNEVAYTPTDDDGLDDDNGTDDGDDGLGVADDEDDGAPEEAGGGSTPGVGVAGAFAVAGLAALLLRRRA